jgi:hypothetical protein
MPGKHEVA